MYSRGTLLLLAAIAVAASAETPSGNSTAMEMGMKTAFRIYDECYSSSAGFTPCLKKKAITFLDRLAKINRISIGEDVYVVKVADAPVEDNYSTQRLNDISSRSAEDQDEVLTEVLFDKLATFFNSRTLQVTFPKMNGRELGRGMEEGRGKMKKMMSMMGMGMAMKMAAMVPMAIAGLFILAGKALITSKIALLLSGIIALKKLLSQKGGGGDYHGGGGGGWSSGGGHGGGGWDRRSIHQQSSIDAQKLAYNSYAP